MWKIHKLIN